MRYVFYGIAVVIYISEIRRIMKINLKRLKHELSFYIIKYDFVLSW